MFKVEKVECYLKGIENKPAGTFKTADGRELAYDAKTVVTISVKDKNGKYMDINTIMPNSTEGKEMIERLSKDVQLMNKFYGTFEIQFSLQGSSKVFITGYSVIK